MIKQVELNLENYGISKFLFYKPTSHAEVNGTEIEILKNSRIPGLLPCAALQQEEGVYLRYDLVSDTTLEKLFCKSVTKELLARTFSNIVETLLEAQKCQLNIENFVFNPKQIFIDNFSSRLVFIYLPVKNNIFEKVSLKEFLKEIIMLSPYDENDDPHFFIKLHNYLLGSAEIDLEGLANKLHDLIGLEEQIQESPDKKREKLPEDRIVGSASRNADSLADLNPNFYSPGSSKNEVKTTVDSGVVTSEYSSQKKDKKKSCKLEIEEEVQYKRITRTELGDHNPLLKGSASLGGTSINIHPNAGGSFLDNTEPEEGTTVLGANQDDEDEGTTMLGVARPLSSRPYLIETSHNEKIIIAKDVFKIGRDPGQADYTSKNKVVGRVHGLVISFEGEYFFEDNDSKNGSYVNGEKVLPKNQIKIKHDDRIKLANEEFIFRLF